jgi:hypothetical protein
MVFPRPQKKIVIVQSVLLGQTVYQDIIYSQSHAYAQLILFSWAFAQILIVYTGDIIYMNKSLMAKGMYSMVISIIILTMSDALPMMVVMDSLTVGYSITGLTIVTRLFTYCGYGIGAIGLVLLHAGLLREGSHND